MKYISILFITFLFIGCTNKVDNLHIIKKDNKYGVVNEHSQLIIKNIFEYIYPFNKNGYAVVKATNGKYGVIDTQNNLKLDTIYTKIGEFYNNRAVIQLENRYGVIDTNYNIIVKPTYDYIEEFIQLYSIYKINEKFGCISSDGVVKLQPMYSSIIRKVNHNLIKKDSKWGIIDNQCNLTISPKFDFIEIIDDDLIKVKLDNHTYLLDKSGETKDF